MPGRAADVTSNRPRPCSRCPDCCGRRPARTCRAPRPSRAWPRPSGRSCGGRASSSPAWSGPDPSSTRPNPFSSCRRAVDRTRRPAGGHTAGPRPTRRRLPVLVTSTVTANVRPSPVAGRRHLAGCPCQRSCSSARIRTGTAERRPELVERPGSPRRRPRLYSTCLALDAGVVARTPGTVGPVDARTCRAGGRTGRRRRTAPRRPTRPAGLAGVPGVDQSWDVVDPPGFIPTVAARSRAPRTVRGLAAAAAAIEPRLVGRQIVRVRSDALTFLNVVDQHHGGVGRRHLSAARHRSTGAAWHRRVPELQRPPRPPPW